MPRIDITKLMLQIKIREFIDRRLEMHSSVIFMYKLNKWNFERKLLPVSSRMLSDRSETEKIINIYI